MAYSTIPKNKDHYDSIHYEGNGYSGSTAKTVNTTNSFRPDWVWVKNMDQGSRHWHSQDSTSGETKWLALDDSDAFNTESDWTFDFESTGISIPNSSNRTNTSSENYITGMFKANGGTTSSNSDGSITSTVQANQTAGFSIVSWTGTGSAGTIGHGLSTKPDWIFVKRTSATEWWQIYCSRINSDDSSSFSTDPETDYIELGYDDTQIADNSNRWNDTAPTTSVFSVGTHAGVNNGSDTYVAYCISAVQGFSHVGLYRGNGTNNSSFVYTGGKPKTLWIKSTSTQDWILVDDKMNFNRQSGSVPQYFMKPENEDAKQTGSRVEFRANGFKVVTSNAEVGDGYKYIYLALLEEPLVSSNGVPATAK